MNEIKSWDKTYRKASSFNADAITTDSSKDTRLPKCRVVAWPEGAPDPSTVPHAGEMVEVTGYATNQEVRHGIPEQTSEGRWRMKMASGVFIYLSAIRRIPDPPTISVGGKKYLESDVISRCDPLEEV